MCRYVCLCVSVHECVQVPEEATGIGFLGAELIGAFESPVMGAGNQTLEEPAASALNL